MAVQYHYWSWSYADLFLHGIDQKPEIPPSDFCPTTDGNWAKFETCNKREDTTEPCTRVSNSRNSIQNKEIIDNTPNLWVEVVKLYRKNKELRY